MIGEVIKGNINDVCAELEREAKRCKSMKVGAWLRLRAIEKAEAEQFGTTVEEIRAYKQKGKGD